MKNMIVKLTGRLAFAAAAAGLLFSAGVEASVLQQLGEETAALVAGARPAVVNLLTQPFSPFEERTEADTPTLPRKKGWLEASPSPGKKNSGSGFFISPDGYLLTTETVIAGAGKIAVVTADGRTYPARVVGREAHFNLALLKVEGDGFPYLKLGQSRQLKEGQLVVTIGNPFGLLSSPSLGIVSGLGRSGLGTSPYEDLIQVNAPINPGDSGGPVLDYRGEVVGMITAAMFAPREAYPESFFPRMRERSPHQLEQRLIEPFFPFNPAQGVGFAITSELIAEILPRLRKEEKEAYGWLGITIEASFTPAEGEKAVLIREVVPSSPAEEAGLRKGDLIVAVDSVPIRTPLDLQRRILFSTPGLKAELEVIRQNQRLKMPVVLGAKPPTAMMPTPPAERSEE